MGRPSNLTDSQWEQLGSRLLKGEKAADLSREFGVSKTSISLRFSKRIETVKEIANRIVETDRAVASLSIADQIAARTLADDLKAISAHLASAAKYGAATAHRLAGIAHAKAAEVDDAKPLDDESRTALRDISALTKMANDASEIGLNLVKANKDAVDEINRRQLDQHAETNPNRGTTFKIVRPG